MNKNLIKWPVMTFVLLLLAGLALCGCKAPEPQDLLFETIDQDKSGPSGRGYGEEEPNLLIIAGSEEVDTPELDIQFPPALAEQLRALDYDRRFVVVVLRGLLVSSSPAYTVETRQVTRYGEKVVLKVHFGEPEGGSYPAFSSPYQVIAVSKEGEWSREIRFVLEVDGKEVKERAHFVP